MTEYYTNKPDFTTEPVVQSNINGSGYSKSMSTIMGDIEAVGNTVKNEGVEDLYIQQGEAALGLTKDSSVFDKSLKRIYTMLTSARKVHSDIIQNIDSKFTKGMDNAFASLNNVNGAGKPYKSEYTKKSVTKEVSRGYSSSYGPLHESVTEYESYSLAELLDGKASPIQAAKDVYDERLRAATEMLAQKDQLSDEQIKALEGKSAEDIVAARYPSQLPDYQKLKASRYYEENKEKLQYVDTGLKVLAGLAMVGGVALAPFTGGTSLYATYAGGAYLATDSAYSAATGHTMITGTQLSTEERVWAGIDAAVTVASMGSAAYLTQLAKAGVSGSTLLKGLASAGKYADDVNDVSKVIYAVASGGNPNSAIQNMVLGQVMGHGLGKAGKYTDVKFGRGGAPEVDVDLPGVRRPATDVDVPKVETITPDSDETVKYYRVQGGGSGEARSRERIIVNDDGTLNIPDKDTTLYVSAYDLEHAQYFRDTRRPGGEIVEFEVPKYLDDLIRENAIPQANAKLNPGYQDGMAPQIVDPTTKGTSYGLPDPFVRWIEEYGTNGRIVD